MRSLIAKDRHVDGCWTSYNPSLERSVLKKAKYLEEASAQSRHHGAIAVTEQAAPVETPAAPAPAPCQWFCFSPEKLKQVWRKES